MPNLILSTCGTSLLTNLAGQNRGLVILHANARSPEEVPRPDREILAKSIEEAGRRLAAADTRGRERISAELNGLLRYYGGGPWPGSDTHWLIATDTWLGQATAAAMAQVIGAGFERSAAGCSPDELRQVNERLGGLARHLSEPTYNPARLDFKKLKVPNGESTQECDAWSKGGTKRIFGHFDGGVFVADVLAEGLH